MTAKRYPMKCRFLSEVCCKVFTTSYQRAWRYQKNFKGAFRSQTDLDHKLQTTGTRSAKIYYMNKQQVSEMWLHQLQTLMSFQQAYNIAEVYPTPRSLLEKYRDPSLTEEEKQRLLEDIAEEKRKARKLSRTVFNFFTSNDPDLVIR
mmetsp:Transcript_45319/g.72761  ORF Transcript_45319/g.72761 Transcript_45319/m.72761 type:complete len:147 (-) Transcript_45319:400-840(-)